MQESVAHIFPAFVLKYTKKELKILDRNNYDFNEKLKLASKLLYIDLLGFDLHKNNFINDELKNQILSYIFSCSFSDVLYQKNMFPDVTSGFSMGVYAAFYHTKALDFATGLHLIVDIYAMIKKVLCNQRYLMASVIGFSKEDLVSYVRSYNSIEIVITNGAFSFVLSGMEEEVVALVEKLIAEGAIHTSFFNVSCPYHSKILTQNIDLFMEIVSSYTFKNPNSKVISMINQEILVTNKQAENEVVSNVCSLLDFFGTIQFLNSIGVKEFIEVGADKSLLKSSKFIHGDFKFQALSKGNII